MSSQHYTNQFPTQSFSTFLIVGLVKFILLNILFVSKKVYNFFTGFQSRLIRDDGSKEHVEGKGRDCTPSTIEQLKREDIGTVLRSLGMSFTPKETDFPESLGENDIFNLFEEKDPSLDEVKQAFDVFDSNRDGFIEEMELQKVLCALGFREGSKMENCRRMIGVFDENEDGRIDFDEFVKFMETSLC